MLSTLSISSPADLNLFYRFGLFENMSEGGSTSRKDKLSSAIFGTFLFRCCSFPYGVCLLVHSRLYYRINVHFFVLNLINLIISYVFFSR